MKNRKVISTVCLIIGIILILICLIGKDLKIFETYKAFFGIMIGIGSGLFGGGLGELINIYLLDKNPILKKKKEIEVNDERNIYIYNKAKSRAFDVMKYVLPMAIFIVILLDSDIVITFIVLSVYIIIYLIYIYYLIKYTKEL